MSPESLFAMMQGAVKGAALCILGLIVVLIYHGIKAGSKKIYDSLKSDEEDSDKNDKKNLVK